MILISRCPSDPFLPLIGIVDAVDGPTWPVSIGSEERDSLYGGRKHAREGGGDAEESCLCVRTMLVFSVVYRPPRDMKPLGIITEGDLDIKAAQLGEGRARSSKGVL